MGTLLENRTGTWVDSLIGGIRTTGNTFKAVGSASLIRARWTRSNTTAANKPNRIAVWDTVTGVVVASVVPADDGLVGTQAWVDFSPPIDLIVGREYRVGGRWPNNVMRGTTSVAPTATWPGALLSWGGSIIAYSDAGGADYPGPNVNNGWAEPFDVEVEPGDPNPDDIATEGGIENALTRWFASGVDNTKTGELPWLTHLLGTDMDAKIDILDAITDDIIATIDNAMGPGGTLITGTVRAALDAMYSLLQTDIEAQPAVVMGPGSPTIADVMNAIDALPTTGGGGLTPLYDGSGDWTQADQTVGQGGFVWVQPADAYVIHVEDFAESARTERAVGAEEIYWLRGWAKPWDGTRWGPEHVIVNGLTQVVQGVRRWGGIGFWVPPDVEWTITAYDYTP